MASTYAQQLDLSPNQADLLRAALSSNRTSSGSASRSSQNPRTHSSPDILKLGQLQTSPQLFQGAGSGSFEGSRLDDSPFIDFDPDFDYDGNFEYDGSNSLNGQMIGALPGTSDSSGHADSNGKRKSFDGYEEEEDGGGKRQETDDKTAKKPGRKPLTSEPTSKRKAQNRAAQRAFRERKEKHLKDLETKVADLEQASESANHENSMLRGQVDRLQNELKIYKKRLTMNGGSGPSRSPSLNSGTQYGGNNFQFDFPKFGNLPVSQIYSGGRSSGHQDTKKSSTSSPSPVRYRQGSSNSVGSINESPNQNHGVRNNSYNSNFSSHRTSMDNANQHGETDPLSGLFSPSALDRMTSSPSDYSSSNAVMGATNQNHRRSLESSAPFLNGGANHSMTGSPSASSVSQHGPGSSCGTSPEPSNHSPMNGQAKDNGLNTINEERSHQSGSNTEVSFNDNLDLAFDNISNTIPRSTPYPTPTSMAKAPGPDVNGIDWLAQQNGGAFNPELFDNYREPQDAIAGGDLSGFFDEAAFAMPDFSSPFNFGNDSPQTPEKEFFQDMGRKSSAAESLPKSPDRSKMLNCNSIWDRIQRNEKFQNGELDVEGLCSELKSKAKCSESGVVVNRDEVDKLLMQPTSNSK